jgi:ABC-type uncharacterized transport system ATPase subunit
LIEQANKRLNKISARCFHEKNIVLFEVFFEKRGDNDNYVSFSGGNSQKIIETGK